MFRRERRCLAIVLTVGALALPAAPAAAAGQGEGGAWAVGVELWARLGEIGDWLHATFLSDGTSYIDPDGLQGSTSDASPFIDPNGLQGTTVDGTSDYTSHIDPNG